MADLVVGCHERVLNITLNRGEKRNALSATMVEGLLGALSAVDPARTDLVVLQGAGCAFSAGFDFSGIDTANDAELCYRFVRIEMMLQTLHHLPVPTLGLAHGASYGAGADLLCACGVRIADPCAEFRLPGLAFGVVLGTRRLAGRVGAERARRLQATGDIFKTPAALQYGFISQIAARADWPNVVSSIAEQVARVPVDARSHFSRAAQIDSRDSDLADLIRAASVPGLADRMRRFRLANR
ncbi:putative enoyl-CoA hydratase echA6 [Mycobacterium basiliense]|uniref:Putative enoyl-CoA hydratase echA6 n=1 Tax=Mycobacterium basiliense TaxID=2094119 RepID=A0A3S4FJX5_9MYCO|nr:enoyl-CoA hydratase/isomerase family protein [Mycobacterium basiliense]VDM86872.1 putative enoyl-CoA hydratase echA6 [Mycobacterium basiliense]